MRDEGVYVFDDVPRDRELVRLRLIEAALDPASRLLIERTSLKAGSSCLEVGAGAGSIAYHLADVAGPRGLVDAIDIDPTFIEPPPRGRAEINVIRTDIRASTIESKYDLVHARYLLAHIPDFERALARMVASLRPGGWLVLEEPDFVAARFASGPPAQGAAFARVNEAIAHMFVSRKLDPARGVHVPGAVRALGLDLVTVDNDAHLATGGSPIARMMKASAEQLRDAYIQTGRASAEDIEGYRLCADDPNTWAIYYATVRLVARKGS